MSKKSVSNQVSDWSLFGTPGEKFVLPERLKKTIREQQERSEILISSIQIMIVTILGLLYAVSPKTFTEDVTFTPVPWALGAYMAFSLLRFWLAIKRKLPDWILYLSAVIDIALLMGLIWSFHLQYEQPASFYLKVPTLLYVFIFIGIRALHFDPRFVIATGASAVIGWSLMVIYVISSDPANSMITRNYIEYMTSNSILIGAEFDKIVSIIMVTGVLALALTRAKNLLIESVIEGSHARDLSRFVPDEVAKRVKSSEEGATTGKGEVNETTILFTDIEGFTNISEKLSPQELIQALNEYFTALAKPIEEYGGVITQFQGDAVLATFNAPRPDPNHASNAIKAGISIQRALQDKTFGKEKVPFNTRVGINSGMVVGGLVGSGDRVGYTVHGDNVNMAARLEALNKDYGTRIIVSENTTSLLVDDQYPFKPLGEVAVRGLAKPVKIFTLDSDDIFNLQLT